MPDSTPAVNSKKKISLELVRVNGQTKFKFKIDPAITAIYANQAREIRTSEAWPGLRFHYLPNVVDSPPYQELLHSYKLFDSYGSAILHNGQLNIAWLRTTTGEGEIVIDNSISIAEMSQLIKHTTTFIKEYFEEFFRSCTVRGSVTINL